MTNPFFGKSVITIDSVSPEDARKVFAQADAMKRMRETEGATNVLLGKVMAALFYEPSSRTLTSFITSMQRLGGGFVPLNNMAVTSVAKGETIHDTARVFSSYADIIVMRHPEKGAVGEFAKFASVPVVNAGDGSGEHPTQALLDSYTIGKHFKSFEGITVGMVGDLLYGRTVHSLSKMLAKLGVKKFVFISPSELRMPKDVCEAVQKSGADMRETENLTEVISSLDVIYMTRVQKERFSDHEKYERLKLAYILTPALMDKAKKTSIVMHPLPRVGEITPDVDTDKRAIYFTEEMRNGMYVRMALIKMILTK